MAQEDLARINTELRKDAPPASKELTLRGVALAETIVGDVRPAILILQAGVLHRADRGVRECLEPAHRADDVARTRELAIRAALGAGRGRLIRQLLTESLIIGLAGGVIGLLAGRWLISCCCDCCRRPCREPQRSRSTRRSSS